MGTQPMRSTQLMFNHGPGSILETVDGPVIVRTFGSLSEKIDQNIDFPGAFEIIEPRLANQLTSPAGIKSRLHWLPSNAEISKGDNYYLLPTNTFPHWMLCNQLGKHNNHAILFTHGSGPKNDSSCPTCGEKAAAIRFVKYCNDGHLDDVSWRYRVCGSEPSPACKESVLHWKEENASMQGVTIECPNCSKSANLGEMSANLGRCSARRPEKKGEAGLQRPNDCDSKVKITQRQSTILWQSVTERVISVPNEDSMGKLIDTLFKNQIRAHLSSDINEILKRGKMFFDSINSVAQLYTRLGKQAPSDMDVNHLIQWIEETRTGIPSHQWYLIDQLVRDLIDDNTVSTFQNTWMRLSMGGDVNSAVDSYAMEYKGLVNSPRPNDVPDPCGRGLIFSMENEVHNATFGDLKLKGEPIQRLRTVTALTGYTRGAIGDLESNTPPKAIELSTNIHGDDWYAASPAFGEGILISLDLESSNIQQLERWTNWQQKHDTIVNDSQNDLPLSPVPWILFRSPRIALMNTPEWRPKLDEASEFFVESHPMFVWWHTFAHHLIRAVQAETGYSSSAISERIYAVPKSDGSWNGAILLYVTEGGMDGTLGGLISLLPHFQLFLDRVRDEMMVCSMDPLCEEGPSRTMPEIGCYACTFNPETSCEHRNMFLDRLLLLEGAGL